MTAKELKMGTPVVFTFKDQKKFGTIETISGIGKGRKFHIRDDAGRLYPHATINSELPIKIELKLTEDYINKSKQQSNQTTNENNA